MNPKDLILEDFPDARVDPALDTELRDLFVTCFPKDEPLFSKHRHYREPPAHRWMIRDASGRLMAHACIHDKTLGSPAGDLHIGGVAEVCVHPDYRGQGLVRLLMPRIQKWLTDRHFDFSILFGRTEVYASSGYKNVDNPLRQLDPATGQWIVQPVANAMILPLGLRPWPPGEIDLRGPLF
jgi:GNAT superfamily N-acetyltransferase